MTTLKNHPIAALSELEILKVLEDGEYYEGVRSARGLSKRLIYLPVSSITVNGSDTLMIAMYRPLLASEAFELARLGADEPYEITDNQITFRLWFD